MEKIKPTGNAVSRKPLIRLKNTANPQKCPGGGFLGRVSSVVGGWPALTFRAGQESLCVWGDCFWEPPKACVLHHGPLTDKKR